MAQLPHRDLPAVHAEEMDKHSEAAEARRSTATGKHSDAAVPLGADRTRVPTQVSHTADTSGSPHSATAAMSKQSEAVKVHTVAAVRKNSEMAVVVLVAEPGACTSNFFQCAAALVPSLLEGVRVVQGPRVVPVFLYRYSMKICLKKGRSLGTTEGGRLD